MMRRGEQGTPETMPASEAPSQSVIACYHTTCSAASLLICSLTLLRSVSLTCVQTAVVTDLHRAIKLAGISQKFRVYYWKYNCF